MMRAPTLILAGCLIAATMTAQEATPPAEPEAETARRAAHAGYSRSSLLHLVREQEEASRRESPVRFHIGSVELRAIGARWRFDFLPLRMPLSGSRAGLTNVWPDPFALTGTPIATPPRAWRTRREADAGLKRIMRSGRRKAAVKAGVKAE